MAYVELPFVERIENLLLNVYVLKILVTVVLYFWIAQQCFIRVVPKLRERAAAVLLVFGAYLIGFIPKRINDVELWLRQLSYAQIGMNWLFPMVLLAALAAAGWFRRRRAPQ